MSLIRENLPETTHVEPITDGLAGDGGGGGGTRGSIGACWAIAQGPKSSEKSSPDGNRLAMGTDLQPGIKLCEAHVR